MPKGMKSAVSDNSWQFPNVHFIFRKYFNKAHTYNIPDGALLGPPSLCISMYHAAKDLGSHNHQDFQFLVYLPLAVLVSPTALQCTPILTLKRGMQHSTQTEAYHTWILAIKNRA